MNSFRRHVDIAFYPPCGGSSDGSDGQPPPLCVLEHSVCVPGTWRLVVYAPTRDPLIRMTPDLRTIRCNVTCPYSGRPTTVVHFDGLQDGFVANESLDGMFYHCVDVVERYIDASAVSAASHVAAPPRGFE